MPAWASSFEIACVATLSGVSLAVLPVCSLALAVAFTGLLYDPTARWIQLAVALAFVLSLALCVYVGYSFFIRARPRFADAPRPGRLRRLHACPRRNDLHYRSQ